MSTPQNAAIYARISSDQEGTGKGIDRQLEDCRKLAADLGWQVAEEYTDNDYSASTRRPRPDYLRMLADIEAGTRDGVLVYHQDRLTRRPKDFEEFLDVLDTARVRDVRFVSGLSGIADGDGLMAVRIMSAVAANETATKSRRVQRKMLQNAEAGLPHGGMHRPYGFEDDKITHRADEAAIIREITERVIAGESLRSITLWLNAEEIPSSTGVRWRSTMLTKMLRSGRIAGLREHRGEPIGPGVWEPIITTAKREQVIATLEARVHSGQRSPRRYLLSGLLRCGKCGTKLYSAARSDTRRYVCKSGADFGGCGGISVVASPVEELLTAAVLIRLDTPELADVLAGRAAADERTAGLSEQLAADRSQLEELAGIYAQRAITAKEWMSARNPIEARVRGLERQISQATSGKALAGLVGNGAALRDSWGTLNLARQRAIVAAVLDHGVISSATPSRRFDPKRVRPVWLL